jgi:hypothetical protein
MQTITGLFDNPQQAARAVAQLEAEGIPQGDISIVSSNVDDSWSSYTTDADSTASGAETGGSLGAILGGGAGLLAGLGMLAIPGLGPVVAAGWLAATAVGAVAGGAAGGLVGALLGAGVEPEHAHVYAEGVRRGGSLVTVRVDDAVAPNARSILKAAGAVDPNARRTAYEAGGWTTFDGNAPTYTSAEIQAERERYRDDATVR